MTDACDLCELPTPDPPVTADDVDGAFCCRGCLTVSRSLDAVEDDVRDRLDGNDGDADTDDVPADVVDSFLAVEGMHCATCEAFVESRAGRDDRVYDADASYASGLVKLSHAPGVDADALASLVDGFGYRAREVESEADDDEGMGRLLVGGFFGMMTMLWYVLFLYPTYLGVDASLLLFDVESAAGQYLVANIWVMTTVVLFYTGLPILRGAYVSLRAGQPNMDLLVATAALTAYVYSTVAALVGQSEVYFDISVVVVLAVTIGGYYEERLREAAAGSLAAVTDRRISTARVRTASGTETRPVEELDEGAEVVVRAGELVPVDGDVVEGAAAVDESLVTGESVPVRREVGDRVLGGSRLRDGGVVVAADAEATGTLDSLLELQWSLRSTRSGAQRLADRLAGVFVPLVFALAALAGVGHLLLGATPTTALLTALTVLVVSCPCALGLATPMAVASGVRDALAAGIVVRSGELFERATDAEVVAFDKTGTLTTGSMTVHEVVGPDETLGLTAALEQFADHPVAAAVVSEAERRADGPTDPGTVTDVETHPGRGVAGTVDGRDVCVGSTTLFAERGWSVPDGIETRVTAARDEGLVPAVVGWDGEARGLVVAGDDPRPEWEAVVERLRGEHSIVVVTGDGEAAASRFDRPGVDEVLADVRPEAKVAVVERLREEGTTVFVGDGSNDAPALAAADLGIALESGTPLAVDAADAVVTTDDLRSVPATFDVTRATRRRIRENLAWAFLYNVVAVPLAALGLLNPLFAAVAMAGSSLLVVANSRRPLLDADATGLAATDAEDATDSEEPHGTQNAADRTSTSERTAPDASTGGAAGDADSTPETTGAVPASDGGVDP